MKEKGLPKDVTKKMLEEYGDIDTVIEEAQKQAKEKKQEKQKKELKDDK